MYEHYYPLGIDEWWMDASEPNVLDFTDMDYRKALCGPTALGSSTEFFNAYALMNAEAIYDGQRSVERNRRVFLFTRSDFDALPRSSTSPWSGALTTRGADMRAHISAGCDFSVGRLPSLTLDLSCVCVFTLLLHGLK